MPAGNVKSAINSPVQIWIKRHAEFEMRCFVPTSNTHMHAHISELCLWLHPCQYYVYTQQVMNMHMIFQHFANNSPSFEAVALTEAGLGVLFGEAFLPGLLFLKNFFTLSLHQK